MIDHAHYNAERCAGLSLSPSMLRVTAPTVAANSDSARISFFGSTKGELAQKLDRGKDAAGCRRLIQVPPEPRGAKLGWTTYAYGPGYDRDTCTASRFHPESETESRCGRPLGLYFNQKTGDLYVADAYKGLMRVPPGGGEDTVLVNQVDGMPLCFTNGVDVDQVTAQVYFTDNSMNYDRALHEMVTKTGDSTGRLMMYDPRTSDVTVLQPRMAYPNSIALSADRTHLVVASTGPCKLLRHWIKGVNAGTSEPFADLSSYPDNVRPNQKGGYWVALHREKNELLPFGRDSHLLVVRVGADDKIVEEMRGPKKVRPTKIMERDNGKLYLRSVELTCVGVVKHK